MFYDNELNPIENHNNADEIKGIVEEVKTFVLCCCPDEWKETVMKNHDNLKIIFASDDRKYNVLINGEKTEKQINQGHGALATPDNLIENKNEISCTFSIVLQTPYNMHQLRHELFHIYSSTISHENGVATYKNGCSIKKWNLDNNNGLLVNYGGMLNEGITEALTSEMEGGLVSKSGYDSETMLANLLVGEKRQNSETIKKCYFGTPESMQEFAKNFNSKIPGDKTTFENILKQNALTIQQFGNEYFAMFESAVAFNCEETKFQKDLIDTTIENSFDALVAFEEENSFNLRNQLNA